MKFKKPKPLSSRRTTAAKQERLHSPPAVLPNIPNPFAHNDGPPPPSEKRAPGCDLQRWIGEKQWCVECDVELEWAHVPDKTYRVKGSVVNTFCREHCPACRKHRRGIQ